jgi:hypothetical protein
LFSVENQRSANEVTSEEKSSARDEQFKRDVSAGEAEALAQSPTYAPGTLLRAVA